MLLYSMLLLLILLRWSLLPGKMKRGDEEWSIRLKPTTDIAAEMGKRKKSGQLFVGFALESDNGLENAKRKAEK